MFVSASLLQYTRDTLAPTSSPYTMAVLPRDSEIANLSCYNHALHSLCARIATPPMVLDLLPHFLSHVFTSNCGFVSRSRFRSFPIGHEYTDYALSFSIPNDGGLELWTAYTQSIPNSTTVVFRTISHEFPITRRNHDTWEKFPVISRGDEWKAWREAHRNRLLLS